MSLGEDGHRYVPRRPEREAELALEAEARASADEWAMIRRCITCDTEAVPVDHDPAGEPWQSCGRCGTRFPGAALNWRVDHADPERVWLILRKGDFGGAYWVDRSRSQAAATGWNSLLRKAERWPESAEVPYLSEDPKPCQSDGCDRLTPPWERRCCGTCRDIHDQFPDAHGTRCDLRHLTHLAAVPS